MLRKFKKQTTGVKDWCFMHKDGRHEITGSIKFDARAPVSDVGTSWELTVIGITIDEVRTPEGDLVILDEDVVPEFGDSFQFSAENSTEWKAEVIDELNAQGQNRSS